MRHVVITGGTRGIGKALSEAFLLRGCSVTLTGRDPEQAEKVAGGLAGQTGNTECKGISCDVARLDDLQRLWQVASEWKKVDIWINNAGVCHLNEHLDMLDPGEIRQLVEINITGTVLGTQTAITGMKRQGSGFIYNMEGFGSDGRLMEGMSVYGSSKRAIRYFTRSMVKELEGSSVRIGTISPGMVVTDLLTRPLREQPERSERALRIFHILADPAERVAPWLAQRILDNEKHGTRIAWLSGRKIAFRFLSQLFRKRKVEGLPE